MSSDITLLSTFRRHHLPLPTIPASLQPRLVPLRDWVWGTTVETYRLYEINQYVEAAIANPGDAMFIGHDGYGTNNWFLHCYLSYGPLSIFIQSPWGGVYGDAEADAQAIQEQFNLLAQLISATEDAIASGKTLPGRLIVCQSANQPPQWGWATPDAPVAWNAERHNALIPALDALRAVLESVPQDSKFSLRV